MLSRSTFAQSFTGLCEVYERTPTKVLVEAYYSVLSDLTERQFADAVKYVLSTRQYTKLPTPGEIRNAAVGDVNTKGLVALEKVEKSASRYGSYSSVAFDDHVIHMTITSMGGWPKFCSPGAYGDDREWHWIQKDFLARYEAFSKSPIPFPPVLFGISDIDNMANGLENFCKPPVLIGGTQEQMTIAKPVKLIS